MERHVHSVCYTLSIIIINSISTTCSMFVVDEVTSQLVDS